MYCPGCGVQNNNNNNSARFCRGCGSDLSLVSQAMTKRVSMVVADKVDKALQWEKNNWINTWVHFHWITNSKRRAWGEFSVGTLSLLAVIWFFFLGRGKAETAWGVITVAACYLVILGIYDYSQYKRSLRSTRAQVESSSIDTRELPAGTASTSALSPQTVTELTTLRLEEKLKLPKES